MMILSLNWTKNYTFSIFWVIAAIFFNYKIWFSYIRIGYVATFSQLGLLCSKFVVVTYSKILLISQILRASDIVTVGWCRLLLATEFAWNQLSFLLALCCWRYFTIKTMSQLWWSVWARINLAAFPHELLHYWSLIWSYYILVWPKYLHLSSLSKKYFLQIFWNLKLQKGFIRDSTNNSLCPRITD